MKHVYIHVPFCGRRCTYCDFAIAVRSTTPTDQFVSAVLAEYDLRVRQGAWDPTPLETLYFGGGTPSRLRVDAVAGLVARIATAQPGGPDAEITLEANPEDVSPESAAEWAKAGINRVSLGIQSFDPRVLAWMHRSHSPEASVDAVRALRDAGIRSVSGDLIFGLPPDLGRDTSDDLARATGLGLDHLSVYGLTVEPRTPLGRWVDRGVATPADDERYAEEFLAADAALTAHGFRHYEVSNFAKPGHESRHNRGYWSGAAYQGLGPAAHRFANGTRSWNVSAWTDYERRIARGDDPTAGSEQLTPAQSQLERLYLALRTAEGLPQTEIPASDVVDRIVTAGFAGVSDGALRLSPTGWLRLDEVVRVLATR